mgnify:CR=1 FL=1
MKKAYYTDRNIRAWVHSIMRDMAHDGWQPDYIVGLTRGGLVPATMLSHYLDVRMHTLDVSFRDGDGGPESNCWMSEDAFGYVPYEGTLPPPEDHIASHPVYRKNILIVDDINDTGRTLAWIKQDWQGSCLPNDPHWESIWNVNVRFAVLVNNAGSEFSDVDYVGLNIDKREDDTWVVFPWENWWE